ncbi:MAG: nitronate monooxygenase [Candidatus Hydrogenedentes bacterium]|nr:nitronate monooxygenase [Candidatus Hydrogenedentota bacterium]
MDFTVEADPCRECNSWKKEKSLPRKAIDELRARVAIPAIAAPMFLVSGTALVIETCKGGVIGTFPALNGRKTSDFEAMLEQITSELSEHGAAHPDALVAPYGVNLIIHRSNPRVVAELCIKFKVPLIITSLGKPTDVCEAVHAYGGLVFSDVANVDHARKAAACGVDGLILVCAGAGGHAGALNPFVFVSAVRQFFDGAIVLAGCISDGRAIRAAEVLGADFAYLGTRFIPTTESLARPEYKEMIVASQAADIVHTPVVSGVPANFMKASLARCGYDVDKLDEAARPLNMNMEDEAKAWRDAWSAGQGVQLINAVQPVRDVVAQLRKEYAAAQRA